MLAAGIALCLTLLAVGVVSHEVLRHVIQAAPLVLFCAIGAYRHAWLRPLVIPIFCFWLIICLLIWGYLLGITTILTGNMTPVETGLTIVMAGICVGGLLELRNSAPASLQVQISLALVSCVSQLAAVWLSFRPLAR
jgi:hypothetical protein